MALEWCAIAGPGSGTKPITPTAKSNVITVLCSLEMDRMLVLRQGDIDEFRAGPDDPRQGAVRREWHVLFEGCNVVLDHLDSSLRASREALVRGVAPLGKDAPLPARRALRFFMPLGATASQLAEPINITLTEY